MAKATRDAEPVRSIVLQPARLQNYKATVEQGVPLQRVARLLPHEEAGRLRQVFRQGTAAVWGLMPDATGSAEKRWARLQAGDHVLFSGRGEIIAAGTVAGKTRSKALATDLWGSDASGRTWELIYFLSELTPIALPYSDFNAIAGYKARFCPRTMFFLPEDKARSVLTGLLDRDLMGR